MYSKFQRIKLLFRTLKGMDNEEREDIEHSQYTGKYNE